MEYPTHPTIPTLPVPTYPLVDKFEDFLDIISALFDRITGPWSELLFKQPFRERIEKVWSNLKDSVPDIKKELNQLKKFVSSGLETAGLAGESLQLKFDGFNAAWHDFLHNGTVARLQKLLGWINILLGSIASVIKPGEALKEFKEAIEKLIES